MEKLKNINGRYKELYSFFRSKACHDALTLHLSKLDESETHAYTHISNLLIENAFLSWCKVFGTNAEDCHWKKILNDHEEFKNLLFDELGISEDEFSEYWKSVIDFRNKWVVHYEPAYQQKKVPLFDIAFASSTILFKYLTESNKNDYQYRGPDSILAFAEQVKLDFLKKLKI